MRRITECCSTVTEVEIDERRRKKIHTHSFCHTRNSIECAEFFSKSPSEREKKKKPKIKMNRLMVARPILRTMIQSNSKYK